jgi:hypothetical protein
MARDGRRRRVLNEGVLATNLVGKSAAGFEEPAPRYGEQASIEHHPQVSDFVPRKKRAIFAALGFGVGVAGLSQAACRWADRGAALVPGLSAETIRTQLAGGATAWTSAALLVIVALASKLVFSLRRHRVGDVRGQYRVWRRASRLAALASVNCTMNLHVAVASFAAAATGWSLTTSASEWWMAPLAVVALWIGIPLVRELAECPAALALAVLGSACYAVGAAGALGWQPERLGDWTGILAGAMPLVGHAFVLAAMLAYARYVVLDVQGLIDHRPERARNRDSEQTPPEQATVRMPESSSEAAFNGPHWDEEAAEADEDGVPIHMSKSERKRQRKLEQRQRRAA